VNSTFPYAGNLKSGPDSQTNKIYQRQTIRNYMKKNQWRTQEFCSGGEVQQIQLRTEGRENGDLGAVAPYLGVSLNL
jgi:hypothetical protein